jgi:hypothetical protein
MRVSSLARTVASLAHGRRDGAQFACLIGELGLTELSACRRIGAARLLARFPQIVAR